MSFSNLEFPAGPKNRTEEVALYMIHALSCRLGIPMALPKPQLSFLVLKDCEMLVGQVYRAYLNPSESSIPSTVIGRLTSCEVKLPWSIQEYAQELTPQQNISTPEREAMIATKFPPLFSATEGGLLPLVDVPCTVVDSEGIIVMWYMPGAMTSDTHVCSSLILSGDY
jgi:hypothetical protein